MQNEVDIILLFRLTEMDSMMSQMTKVIEPLEQRESDIAIDFRFLKKEGFQSSSIRQFGIRFLSGLLGCVQGRQGGIRR